MANQHDPKHNHKHFFFIISLSIADVNTLEVRQDEVILFFMGWLSLVDHCVCPQSSRTWSRNAVAYLSIENLKIKVVILWFLRGLIYSCRSSLTWQRLLFHYWSRNICRNSCGRTKLIEKFAMNMFAHIGTHKLVHKPLLPA